MIESKGANEIFELMVYHMDQDYEIICNELIFANQQFILQLNKEKIEMRILIRVINSKDKVLLTQSQISVGIFILIISHENDNY